MVSLHYRHQDLPLHRLSIPLIYDCNLLSLRGNTILDDTSHNTYSALEDTDEHCSPLCLIALWQVAYAGLMLAAILFSGGVHWLEDLGRSWILDSLPRLDIFLVTRLVLRLSRSGRCSVDRQIRSLLHVHRDPRSLRIIILDECTSDGQDHFVFEDSSPNLL